MFDLPTEYENYFDGVVDKGTLDAMLYSDDKTLPYTILQNVSKVIKPTGVLIQITSDPPELRLDILRDGLDKDWSINYNLIPSKDALDLFDSENMNSINYYLYKAKKPG